MQSATTGFVFPGQGSQKVGMLADLADTYPQISATFSAASAVLGFDLWALTQGGPEEELAKTHITQPLMLTSSVALWRLWQSMGGTSPSLMAGHSLGEYSALTCAGVIGFDDAVALVHKRGAYMQTAVPLGAGGMVAIIGLEDDKVMAACAQARQGEEVAAVNFNCPGQVVIAGHTAAIARASELCKLAGAKRTLTLPVSAPFHSPLMRPAADKFAADLAQVEFHAPRIPVLQNFGLSCPDDPGTIRNNLISQIYNPVPWVDTINRFAAEGISLVIEMGPGRVLNGFNKRIQPEMTIMSVNDKASLDAALAL